MVIETIINAAKFNIEIVRLQLSLAMSTLGHVFKGQLVDPQHKQGTSG